jgi:hypothetical protein
MNNQKWLPVCILIVGVAIAAYLVGQNSNNITQTSPNQPIPASPISVSSMQSDSENQIVTPQETPTPLPKKIIQNNITHNQTTSPSQVAQQSFSQQPPQTSHSPNTIFATLSPQLAFVTCNWYNRYGNVLFSKSSNGLLGPPVPNGSYFITSVMGGVIDTAYIGSVLAPGSCTISFPAGTSLYAGGLSTFSVGLDSSGNSPVILPNPNIDFAQVAIKIQNGYVANYAQKINYCTARPSLNDSIAVFGWPINSSGQTLTGTVTGFSGYYDTTDISIPNGMQGSTVVSLTSGCVIGQINALGQIADTQALSYIYGF